MKWKHSGCTGIFAHGQNNRTAPEIIVISDIVSITNCLMYHDGQCAAVLIVDFAQIIMTAHMRGDGLF